MHSKDTCWSIKIRCRKDFLGTVNLFNLLWCARPAKITCTQTYGEKNVPPLIQISLYANTMTIKALLFYSFF